MIDEKDYLNPDFSGEVYGNTEKRELDVPDFPQGTQNPAYASEGEEPKGTLSPNPGYGEDGETKNAIKTDLAEGPRGTPVIVGTPAEEGVKVEQNIVNFLKGILIKGLPLEEYIDKEGGVTQEELTAALLNKATVYVGSIIGDETKFTKSMKVGDIIIDDAGFIGLIKDISFTGNTLSEVKIAGIENNLVPTLYEFDGSLWTDSELESSVVIANPTLAGTESALTGLQIGNTKYKNTILYKHEIEDDNGKHLVIINTSPTPINTSSVTNLQNAINSGISVKTQESSDDQLLFANYANESGGDLVVVCAGVEITLLVPFSGDTVTIL